MLLKVCLLRYAFLICFVFIMDFIYDFFLLIYFHFQRSYLIFFNIYFKFMLLLYFFHLFLLLLYASVVRSGGVYPLCLGDRRLILF